MTTIKPPAPGTTVPNTHSDAVAGGTAGAEHAASSSAHPSTGIDQANAAGAAGQAGADPIAQLARTVESGSLSLDSAVDSLLGQTLARAQRHLTSEQLAELSGLLRDALLSDPTLSAMRGQRG